MALESGNWVGDLVATNPAGTDAKSQGDDHIRLIKKTLRDSFAGFTGAIMVTGPESGAANAYVLTPATALPSYVAGMGVTFMAGNANTGPSTLNISGLGVKALKGPSGDNLLANEIDTAGFVNAVYDGTRFLLKAPSKEWVEQQALSAVLPGLAGNAGKFLQDLDNVSAGWAYAGITGYAAKTANYTVATTDRERLIESTASTGITLALPAAATATAQFAFYAQAAAAGSITAAPDGSDLINGAATYVLRAGEGALIFCDGSGWHVYPGRNTTGEDLAMFGDGADGDVTVTGAVTLTRDMYYNSLTLGSGAALMTSGWRVFVKNILDLTAAPAGAIQWNGNSGVDALGTTPGAAATSLANGAFMGTNTPAAAGTPSAPGTAGSALGSNGGKGGGNGAAAARPAVPVGTQTSYPVRRASAFSPLLNITATGVVALMGGGTGSSGNADAGGAAASGGAGNGGGAIAIFARVISRGAVTGASAIQAKGGGGGAGGSTASGNTSGASGAGAGGGGWVYLVYRFLMGAAVTGLIDVTGGNGGRGGNGNGTGQGGDGGSSGEGGRIQVYNLATGAQVEVVPIAAAGGAAHSGVTGGLGGGATSSRLSL